MFGSDILDVAIGLVLVFLLVSLVLSGVQEAIEAWLRSRAGDLNRALFELLQSDGTLLQALHDHPLMFALNRAGLDSDTAVKALPKPTWWPFSKAQRAAREARALLPSYIPREVFAVSLIDLLSTGKMVAGEGAEAPGEATKKAHERLVVSMEALRRVVGDDIARVRAEVEGWYDGAMDRASGWFKRRTQKILFFLGLAAAVALNLNAVVLGNYLATNKAAREYAAVYAKKLADAGGTPQKAQIGDLYGGLQDTVGLPVGWSPASVAKLSHGYPAVRLGLFDGTWQWGLTRDAALALLAVTIGYLITAFAAMLGAPFWFDVLNRIMVIRSTVKPKEKSPDEPSADGGVDKNKASGNSQAA